MISRRGKLAAATGLIVTVGLTTRLPGIDWSPFVAKYLGATLWGAMVYGLVALLRPQWHASSAALLAAFVAATVELSQLWHQSWLDAFRATPLGVLLLGRFFAWADIVAYFVGISAAAAVDSFATSAMDASPPET